jgi:hypothetical protein
MPSRHPPSQPRRPLLTVAQRQAAKVLAVELQKVEGVQHGLGDGAVAVQSIEDDASCPLPSISRSATNCARVNAGLRPL